eukprot:scaffold83796_cov75-Phaeocystis_antarctica.AAC.1
MFDDVGLGFLDAVAQPFGHGSDLDAELGRPEQQRLDALDRVAVGRLGADHEEEAVRREVPTHDLEDELGETLAVDDVRRKDQVEAAAQQARHLGL